VQPPTRCALRRFDYFSLAFDAIDYRHFIFRLQVSRRHARHIAVVIFIIIISPFRLRAAMLLSSTSFRPPLDAATPSAACCQRSASLMPCFIRCWFHAIFADIHAASPLCEGAAGAAAAAARCSPRVAPARKSDATVRRDARR